jgi:hypothetical protein
LYAAQIGRKLSCIDVEGGVSMPKRLSIAIGAITFALAPAVSAQDAAESAVIYSGTSQGVGASSRSLGGAAAGAIGRATEAIRASRPPNGNGSSARATRQGGGARHSSVVYAIASNVDPLEYYAVPTYRLGNGRTLRVSGTLYPAPPTVCVLNCS